MKSRVFIFVIIFGFGAIVVGWVYESSLRPSEKKVSLVFPDDIDYFLTNLHYRALRADGKLDFQFLSPRLEHFPRNDISRFEEPSMQVYTESISFEPDRDLVSTDSEILMVSPQTRIRA